MRRSLRQISWLRAILMQAENSILISTEMAVPARMCHNWEHRKVVKFGEALGFISVTLESRRRDEMDVLAALRLERINV